MDLRDENGPITVERPLGLLRRAMVELGTRLSTAGKLNDPDHIFELDEAELSQAAAGRIGPSPEELSRRAERRCHLATVDPPQSLGLVQGEPDLSALPSAMAELIGIVDSVLSQLGMAPTSGAHSRRQTDTDSSSGTTATGVGVGVGVGRGAYTGPARVVADADEALATLEAGEILVTRTTSPAFNLALTYVGGLVTAEGGPMSHAAVLARELGFPAVIGVGPLDRFASGQQLTIDPEAGTVIIESL